MTKWHRISINLTEKDYRTLKLLAGLKAQSVTHFIRYLLDMHIKLNECLLPYLKPIEAELEARVKEESSKAE